MYSTTPFLSPRLSTSLSTARRPRRPGMDHTIHSATALSSSTPSRCRPKYTHQEDEEINNDFDSFYHLTFPIIARGCFHSYLDRYALLSRYVDISIHGCLYFLNFPYTLPLSVPPSFMRQNLSVGGASQTSDKWLWEEAKQGIKFAVKPSGTEKKNYAMRQNPFRRVDIFERIIIVSD